MGKVAHRVVLLAIAKRHGIPLEEMIYEWEERAAVMEFEGGLARTDAETKALADVKERWRDRW